MRFTHFEPEYYRAVCTFLIEANQADRRYINWNWARFEWMYGHQQCDRSQVDLFGLWWDADRVVGAAIYDMYPGEGFCGVLSGYEALLPDVLRYARDTLGDDTGMGIIIGDADAAEIKAAVALGFAPTEQKECMLRMELSGLCTTELPMGYRFATLDQTADAPTIKWLLWQGFDHGDDYAAFLREDKPDLPRLHFNRELSIAVVAPDDTPVAYCCGWYDPGTSYLYVEPVCTVPAYRGRGLGQAMVTEMLRWGRLAGASEAYVLSDNPFYTKLGFVKDRQYTLYHRD